MNPSYSLHRYPHGWLLCAPPTASGVPIHAFTEATRLCPGGRMHPGIAHHYTQITLNCHPGIHAIAALGKAKPLAAWAKDINDYLDQRPDLTAADRWWLGTDVGLSSAALFGAMATANQYAINARHYGQRHTPRDAADFGRCHRLVELMGWRTDLQLVADAYPDTLWPKIIAQWDTLTLHPELLTSL